MEKKLHNLHLSTTYLFIISISSILNHASFSTASTGDDFRCLRGIAEKNKQLKWNLSSSVCSFTGVECFKENRILEINLQSMSLSGDILSYLRYCTYVYKLNLSNNNLTGSIPLEVCYYLPNLEFLDLSNNQLTGFVPSQLSMCPFLNTVILDRNKFSGEIPSSLAYLSRLTVLNLSNNQLCGVVPTTLIANFNSSSFQGNYGLCSEPKKSRLRVTLVVVVIAGIVGSAVGLSFTCCILWFWLRSTASLTSVFSQSFTRSSVIIVFVCWFIGGVIGVIIASGE